MPEESVLQLGALGIILVFAIKEFFSYLKTKKDGNGNNGNGLSASILTELRLMNNNHLHSIQETMEEGNARLIDAIHNDNIKIIEMLGEIKGLLRK